MPAYISGIIWVCQVLEYEMDPLPVDFFHCVFICSWLLKSFFISYLYSQMIPGLAGLNLPRKWRPCENNIRNAFIFAADDYKTSAVLNFYLDEMVYSKNIVGQKALQFDFIGSNLRELNGKDAIFIDSNPRFNNLENENAAIPSYFNILV